MAVLSSSLIQFSFNFGCTIAAKHRSSSLKQCGNGKFKAEIMDEINALQCTMPDFLLSDSIFLIKIVRVGS
jgi:hypothetical protein